MDDIVTFQEYEDSEKGNLNKAPKVSFILTQTPADVTVYSLIDLFYSSFHFNWLKSITVPFLHASSMTMILRQVPDILHCFIMHGPKALSFTLRLGPSPQGYYLQNL